MIQNNPKQDGSNEEHHVEAAGKPNDGRTKELELSERKFAFEVWKAYEEVAMHFNGLVIRLRTQALAAVTAFVAI